jgi:hypothetical protein
MGWTCSSNVRDIKYIPSFGGEVSCKATSLKSEKEEGG